MLYYGDRARTVVPREVVIELARQLDRARALAGGARAAALLDALIAAGELAQGLADRAFEREGRDDEEPLSTAALEVAIAIAGALGAAHRAEEAPWPRLDRLLGPLPPSACVNVPEGYAHYALYPEAYAEAARRVRGRSARWFVVGIRSIGTSLAAVVGVALGASDVVTVRPAGHPFRRRLRPGPGLARRTAAAIARGARFAIVDEGPGLSGSSFEAVAAWLRDAGARAEDLTFFPGHGGALGPAAPDARREWWAGADRRVASFEEAVLPALRIGLERAFGPGPVEDAGAGRWRSLLGGATLPVFQSQERRKYLCRRRDGSFLARFAGLGPHQREIAARAQALAEARWSPPVRSVFPGFVASPVLDVRGRRDDPGGAASPSTDELERYLEFRARVFPAGDEDGAAAERVLEMLRVNAREALGADAAGAVERYVHGAAASEGLPRVAVDGKLEPWEWVRDAGGRIWKLDATDHASGHDRVGCQPITWDVAGARVELGMGWDRAVALATRLGGGGRGEVACVERVLGFHEAAYLAHRIGRWTFALHLEPDPQERALIEATLRRYTALFRERLSRPSDS